MQKCCPICGDDLRRGSVKVACEDCRVKTHLNCLAGCELYNILQSSSPKFDASRPSHNSTISIRCIGCLKHGPKKKITCTIEPLDYATFYVPLRITDSKESAETDNLNVTTKSTPAPELSLGKREPDSMENSTEIISLDKCQQLLAAHQTNHYVSVNVLSELRKHEQPIVWSKEDLTYEIPRHVLEKYQGYKCACGTLCAFSCVSCYLSGEHHIDCLKKLGDSEEFTLNCLICHQKSNSRGRSKKVKTLENYESEPKSTTKEQKSKLILLRSAPHTMVQILNGAVNSALNKKLSSEVLK